MRPLLFASLALALLLSHPAAVAAHILDIASGNYIAFEQMLEDLQDAELIFIGELHDHPGHHRAQLQVIKGLHERGVPVAVGLEMARQSSQPAFDSWIAGEMEISEFRQVFDAGWGMWDFYVPILEYARQEKIPLVALNVDRNVTQQVAREGFASLSDEQLAQVPDVECNIDDDYRRYIRRSLGAHAHGDVNFENFCEAQMVWDSVMANNLVNYLQQEPDRQVIVLAGSGHAWKHGIPEQVRRRGEFTARVLLPDIPGRIGPGDASREETDYLLIGLEEGDLH